MAFRNSRKIQSYILKSSRNASSCKKEQTPSFWDYFKKKEKEAEKPKIEQCRKRRVEREDPDLSRFGGQPYRTCGPAYVIQKDMIPPFATDENTENAILRKIEADLSVKDTVCDPMPPFKTVEQRLLDLTERKLHPFYKYYLSLPKKDFEEVESPKMPFRPYKCNIGPVSAEEIPDVFKFNKKLLERKNIFADFKRVELPKQMVRRIIEMDKNRKPTMEQKGEKKQEEAKLEKK